MKYLLILLALLFTAPAFAQSQLYEMPAGETHWASPENPTGAHGIAGLNNNGGKGHPSDWIPAHGSIVLADVKGAGIIDRIWLTIDDRSAQRLRELRLDIYWDGAKTPAVSAPLGDFFAQNAGEMKTMDTALFVSAEGRSFVSLIPMPFRTGARVVISNDGDTALGSIFDDVDYRTMKSVPDDALYFHAWWHRDRATTLGQPFQVLPQVTGRGRFLGASYEVQTNPLYGKSWFGEGEVRMTVDGGGYSLSGTGTEDYIGDAWGQNAFIGRYTGAPVADDTTGRFSFYRFHIPDPVVFTQDLNVVWQQLGGFPKADVIAMQKAGAPLVPVTVGGKMLLDHPQPLTDSDVPDGWVCFYRSDDVSAVAYFYLDRPENGLPPLAPVADRIADLRTPAK